MPVLNIETLDDQLVLERDESFVYGMDGYSRSTLLKPGTYQYGENGIVPNDFTFQTRYGADRLGTDAAGRVQGLLYFETPTVSQLIRCANQAFQYWNGTTWNAMAGFSATDAVVDISMEEGIDKVLITDGVQNMQIWDGTTFTDAGNGATSPPVGATILLWHANRMWAAGFSGAVAGKERDAIWGSALLTFGLGDWDNTNRNIRIGSGDGEPIRGLASLSSGFDKGFVMAILKANSVYLINTDPTATFTNFTLAIGPEQITDGIGCVGKRAFCVYGNDLLFVSPDKSIRSLARMQSAQGQYQVSAPLSLPIQPYVDRINWNHADKIAVVKYRELALFAVPLDAATDNNTVFVWNGRLQQWVGVWTGWTPTCWSVSRFSAVHNMNFGDTAGSVKKWKDYNSALDDATYLDDGEAIPTRLWTRGMLFQEPLNPKDAFHYEGMFGTSNSTPTFTLIADNSPLFSWSKNVASAQVLLPQTLPFNLVSDSNIPARQGLRGLTPFIECYVKIESTEGWWALRTSTMSAFLNSLLNE